MSSNICSVYDECSIAVMVKYYYSVSLKALEFLGLNYILEFQRSSSGPSEEVLKKVKNEETRKSTRSWSRDQKLSQTFLSG